MKVPILLIEKAIGTDNLFGMRSEFESVQFSDAEIDLCLNSFRIANVHGTFSDGKQSAK